MPKGTHQPAMTAPPLELSEQVSVALAELAGAAREGLRPWPWGPACR
jgi:hypothetical protein